MSQKSDFLRCLPGIPSPGSGRCSNKDLSDPSFGSGDSLQTTRMSSKRDNLPLAYRFIQAFWHSENLRLARLQWKLLQIRCNLQSVLRQQAFKRGLPGAEKSEAWPSWSSQVKFVKNQFATVCILSFKLLFDHKKTMSILNGRVQTGQSTFLCLFKKSFLAWAATEVAVMQSKNFKPCISAAPLLLIALTNFLRRISTFSKSYSLRRVYCLNGHGDHCFAKLSVLHYSGSIAFRCAIHLSTKVFLFIVLCSYFNILSSRQDLLICFDNWRYRSTVFPARAAIFPSSYSLNAYLILNVKTFYFWIVLCWRLKINAFPIFALIVTQTGYLFVPSSYISRHSLFNPK